MAIPSEWEGPPVKWAGLPVSPTLPYLLVLKVCLMRPVLSMAFCRAIPPLLLLKEVSSAWLRESDIHPVSPKTTAPQYQPIDRKKRMGKIVEDYSMDRAAYADKKALALLLKPASPTPSNPGSTRSFQRDIERETKVLRYCEVLHRGGS